MEKCHRCKKQVIVPWKRGPLVFCSPQCRDESWNEGEPIEGMLIGPGDYVIDLKGSG